FGGLDTLADVFLNGKLAGSSENMFIEQTFDVSGILKSGENTIDVIFRSAPIEAAKYDAIVGGGVANRTELVHIRKAPASFGWDIHPRLVSAGIWKSARLEIRESVRIVDACISTMSIDPKKRKARVYFEGKFDAPFSELDALKAVVSISDGAKILDKWEGAAVSQAIKSTRDLSGVEAWWPRGCGKQKLYDVSFKIVRAKDGKVLDERRLKAGFRTVDLEFKEIEIPEGGKLEIAPTGNVWGELPAGAKPGGEFKFRVNGEPIFIKGTNWVPLDASHSRDAGQLDAAVKMLADLNCNMVRMWGGNVYEPDRFFDFCDENGILVWQDFSLGCSVYPQNPKFAEKIREEAAAVVKRLRSRACLALWAGNNENDQAYSWVQGKSGVYADRHDKISREVIPSVIREYDWRTPYLPSSPYLTEKTRLNPEKFAPPEAHQWRRDYYKDPFYTKALALFVSEIGYHGCPSRASLEKMMDAKFVYPWDKKGAYNRQWQAKAVMPYANAPIEKRRNLVMTRQAASLFGECPKDLDDFIFASQASQAEGVKYFIENARSQKFAPKTGILWWNLRDAWPIISDAVVDYYNSKKLAYHYIKRVQADVCAMIGDNLEISVANGTREKVSGKVRVVDADSGREVFAGAFEVPANGLVKAGKVAPPNEKGMLLVECEVGGKKFPNHYLYGKPPFALADYKRWHKALGVARD
ncbi:MAG: hypothetical protein IJI37_04120, partial [Opitutales bacterium]|nr:hypothetical protein [Opitutales bacterium]